MPLDPLAQGLLAQLGASGAPLLEAQIHFHWSLACTGKFVWPIPDKGLKKRIHRITAPTLLVWGKGAKLVPPVYAQEFASRIPGARLELVDQAGHMPQMEQSARVAALVRGFLSNGDGVILKSL